MTLATRANVELFNREPSPQEVVDISRKIFRLLGDSWSEIPYGKLDRVSSKEHLSTSNLGESFRKAEASAKSQREWYRQLYAPTFTGKRVLEIGSGGGLDAAYFIQHGAIWTCTDVSASNLQLIERTFRELEIEVPNLHLIEDMNSFSSFDTEYDFVFAQGSLINVPLWLARLETQALLPLLKTNGRWIELCYPKSRWLREGKLSPEEWAPVTDGPGKPWIEWYDWNRMQDRFYPYDLEKILELETNQGDFNWFDMKPKSPKFEQQHSTDSYSKKWLLPINKLSVEVANDSAVVLSDKGIDIESDERIWSYAILLSLPSDVLQVGNAECEIWVNIHVLVGHVGVGWYDKKERNFVNEEVRIGEGQHREVYLGKSAGASFILCRNNWGSGKSRFKINEIKCRSTLG